MLEGSDPQEESVRVTYEHPEQQQEKKKLSNNLLVANEKVSRLESEHRNCIAEMDVVKSKYQSLKRKIDEFIDTE